MGIHPSAALRAAGGVFGHKGFIFDHFELVFRRNFDKVRTAIVKLCTNFVPIIANIMTKKVPIIFHIKINVTIRVRNQRFELKLGRPNRSVSVQRTSKWHSRGLGTPGPENRVYGSGTGK